MLELLDGFIVGIEKRLAGLYKIKA